MKTHPNVGTCVQGSGRRYLKGSSCAALPCALRAVIAHATLVQVGPEQSSGWMTGLPLFIFDCDSWVPYRTVDLRRSVASWHACSLRICSTCCSAGWTGSPQLHARCISKLHTYFLLELDTTLHDQTGWHPKQMRSRKAFIVIHCCTINRILYTCANDAKQAAGSKHSNLPRLQFLVTCTASKPSGQA